MRLFFVKEDVRLGVIRKKFKDVFLDMVAVLLRVQQLFANLMEEGKTVCGNVDIIVINSSSYS